MLNWWKRILWQTNHFRLWQWLTEMAILATGAAVFWALWPQHDHLSWRWFAAWMVCVIAVGYSKEVSRW